ncbi:MAG: hypothetical protein QOI48_1289 [Solirubrobacteraceae bacterium]|jgi:hypothetical protein|nr:hypothetical protein [Solirubrobacteraceae bacterium]
MPLEDFLAGLALFAAMLGAVAVVTAIVVRRRLQHLDVVQKALACIVVGSAVLIGVHLVPMTLGVLDRFTVLVACATAVGLTALLRPAVAPQRAEECSPTPPPSGPVSWALAALASAFAAVAFLADLGRWAGDELVGVDPLTFHMPNIGRWIQTGSLWQIDQFVPLQSQGYYPNNGDVVLLGTVLPWHNDFLARFPTAFFLLVTGIAVSAIAREFRAPPAAAILAGAACVSIPIAGLASIPRALPDSLLWAMLACGVLFLLRHARTRRRSDLVLAGVALAVACGTKWYGLTSLAAVVLVWMLGRAAQREPARVVLRDALLVASLGALGIVVWLVRNLVESGDPLFPVNIAPFGITIFDAPPDVLRDLAGFTVAGYLDQPRILPQLAREIFEGLGPLPIVCLPGVLAAVLRARRPGDDRRVIVLAIAAILLAAVYAVTPFSALGLRDDPSLASVNTRYAVPALLLAAPLVAWAAGRLTSLPARVLEAGLAVAAIWGAYEGFEVSSPREIALALVALGIVAGTGWIVWRLRSRPPALAAAAVVAALIGVLGVHRIEQRVNGGRYLEDDPAVGALLRLAPTGKRIGHAGDWSIGGLSPIWPSFGTRIGNAVDFVGYFDHGWLRRYANAASFAAALKRGRYDVLVLGRGFYPPQHTPEQRWAMAAGWRTVALSTRLRVLVAPAG